MVVLVVLTNELVALVALVAVVAGAVVVVTAVVTDVVVVVVVDVVVVAVVVDVSVLEISVVSTVVQLPSGRSSAWPFSVAMSHARVKLSSHAASSAAKRRIASAAGPLGLFRFPQSLF